MKVLVIASFAESLLKFRGSFLSAIVAQGHAVHVAAPGLSVDIKTGQLLEGLGLCVHKIPIQRAGINPLADLMTMIAMRSLISRIEPDMVLGYTVKPVIYGCLAAWLERVPSRYALITGLGYAFAGRATGLRSLVRSVVQCLYRHALRRAHKVFFQNPDDEALFRKLGLLQPGIPSVVVNGSGIDLASFELVPLPPGQLSFLLLSRLLGDKGVREYAQAAQRVKAKYPQVRFSLAGWLDENPDAIAQSELDAWVQAGSLDFLGRLSDVRPAIQACSVYVLPSYREGTPRTVLEAMAMGRSIITTDAPGCRETVIDGDNGFLVPVKSVDALVAVMERFIKEPNLLERMGKRSRQIAEDKYDVHKVNAVMIREMGL